MALQVMVKPNPSSPATDNPSLQHRAILAAVLREIPSAAEAMRRARARRPTPPRTVFVLDWDDTCCATSYLERCGVMADLDTRLEEFAPQLDTYLRLLELRVLALLKTAVHLGTALIVTNAGDGWVELSSSRFLPAVRAFLLENERHVKIVSARARYVHAYRTQPLQWKALTFADELRPLFAHLPHRTPMHVVVLGDSVGDQYAAHAAAHTLTSSGLPVVLKVVKFLERPTIDQLCKELAVVLDHIHAMTAHTSAFDVSMYKDVAAAPPSHHHHHHHHNVPTAQHHPHHLTAQEMTVPTDPPASPNAPTDAGLAAVTPMPTCAAAV